MPCRRAPCVAGSPERSRWSLVLAVAGAAAWSQRKPLAHWWTLRQLAQRGIAPASVEVARFDASRLELRGLRAGAEGQLSIDAIDADYTLGQLWRGRVAALRIVGVRLTGEIAEGEARFGGLEGRAGAEDAADDTASALRLPVLPTNQLVIEDARAEIATAQGPLAVVLSLNAQDSEGRISAHGDLVARSPARAGDREARARGRRATQVAGGAAIGLRIAQGADLGLPLSAGSLALAAQVELSGGRARRRALAGLPRADARERQGRAEARGQHAERDAAHAARRRLRARSHRCRS